MSDRENADWLDSYLEYTQNSEPPTSFHTWCGLAMVSAALQRRVYLRWGFEVIRPNLYVVLVSPSGKARKGVALGIAKEMLQAVPTLHVAPEASTREALISAMKRASTNFNDPSDNVVKFHCALTAFSEELSVFLGQNDIKFLVTLTDWYDSKDTWTYETIGRGKDQLQGVCFTLIGGTAPDWIQSMLPQEAVGGGFTARIVFVVEERKGKTVPKHTITHTEDQLKESLIRDLERIVQLNGPFHFDAAGEAAYTNWYVEQDELMHKGELAVDDPRFASYCERRTTHIRKLMMILSACRGDDMQLTLPDFAKALRILKATEAKMHKTFGGLGKAKDSDATEIILNYIKTVGITSRSILLAKFYRDIDSGTLRQIEETLTNMKMIKIRLIPEKGDKAYEWIGPK